MDNPTTYLDKPMFKKKYNKSKVFSSIAFTQIWGLIILFLSFVVYSSKVISLTGYVIYFFAVLVLIRAIYSNHIKVSFFIGLFLFWVIYLIASAIPNLFNDYKNYLYLKQFISGQLFLYVIPFLIIAHLNLSFYKALFKFAYIFVLLYFMITIFLFYYLIQDITRGGEALTFLMTGAAPLILTLTYHSKKHRAIILIAILLLVFEMMILGRRNVVLYFGSVLFLSFIIALISKQTFSQNKKLNYLFLAIAIVFFSGLVLSLFSKSFEFFFERIQTGMESREGIIDLFFYDFNRNPLDWITGRGVFGQFEGGILATDKKTGLRDGIENGYLYLILKGGGIYLGLLIIISLKAMYNGFFKSRNLLVKGFAAIILIYFIDMIGFGIPMVNLKYIIIFIAIAACNTKWLRELTDEFLSKEIGLK